MAYKLARPKSRNEIKTFANKFRKIFGLNKEARFPIIEFIEWLMPQIDEKFDLEIVEVSELPYTYAVTYPDESRMVIRRDVYDDVCEDQGRARFTVAHELGHYWYHGDLGFARSEERPEAYRDPEWQANVFAAELLIPFELTKDMSVDEIAEKCKVSKQCAKIQYNENLKRKR